MRSCLPSGRLPAGSGQRLEIFQKQESSGLRESQSAEIELRSLRRTSFFRVSVGLCVSVVNQVGVITTKARRSTESQSVLLEIAKPMLQQRGDHNCRSLRTQCPATESHDFPMGRARLLNFFIRPAAF